MDLKKAESVRRKVGIFKCVNLTYYIFLVILRFMSMGMFIVTPLILNNLINDHVAISIIHVLIIILFLLGGHVLDLVITFINNKVVADFNHKAMKHIYRIIFNMSYDNYLKKEPMNLIENVRNVLAEYAGYYLTTIPTTIMNILIIVATLIIVASMSPFIALLMLFTLPINYFGFKALNKKLALFSNELREKNSKSISDQNTIVSHTDFIKQNADNEPVVSMLANIHQKMWKLVGKVNNYAIGVSSSLSAVNIIISNLLTVLIAYMMLQDQNFMGSGIFIVLVTPYFTRAVGALTNTNNSIAAVKAGDMLLAEILEGVAENGTLILNSIDNITMKIEEVKIDDLVLIEDVNMRFEKGDIIGIVGESGKGKSTLVKLITKFREVDGIYLNETIDINETLTEKYLKLVSYYSQNVPIISGTILDNLNYGRTSISEDNYKRLGFLDKFPNLEEYISENGANLSAGDKQRIALARFFTEDADIVILDEPTSSLDEETENQILTEIFQRKSDKIIFFITHKKDNLKFCTHTAELKEKSLIVEKNIG